MRTIKFRAWDLINKRWIELSSIQIVLGQINAVWELTPEENEMYGLHQVELVQFTGLLDKNGKEIYEGDIIQDTIQPITGMPIEDGAKAVIKWSEDSWSGGWLPWAIGGLYAGRPPFYKPDESCIVIGNIYENPELMENYD